MFNLRGLALIALVALSGCVATTSNQTSQQTTAGIVEPVSGINTDAVASIAYLGSERFFVVFYDPTRISAAQKAAAPAKLCASRGLRVSAVEDKPLEHPEEMPGVMKLVVRCK